MWLIVKRTVKAVSVKLSNHSSNLSYNGHWKDLQESIPSVAPKCGHITKKHDLIWYQRWQVWTSHIWSLAAHYANFCTCHYPPEMTLGLNSVNRHVLHILWICLNAKIFMLAKDTGCFTTFIQTAITDNSLWVPKLKCLMTKHVTFSGQLDHVFTLCPRLAATDSIECLISWWARHCETSCTNHFKGELR